MDSRIKTTLGVYVFLVTGVFLATVPWTPVWPRVIDALLPLPWSSWLNAAWFRGGVTALGLLDLMMALQGAGDLVRDSGGRGARPADHDL